MMRKSAKALCPAEPLGRDRDSCRASGRDEAQDSGIVPTNSPAAAVTALTSLTFIGMLLIPAILRAQWQPDQRLTSDFHDSFTSLNNAHCVAADANGVHVVWSDNRDRDWEVYYKRSTDGGATWGQDMRLTVNSGGSRFPAIAVADSSVYVVWYDTRDSSDGIFFKRSTDDGATWGSDLRLNQDTASVGFPSVAADGHGVDVVWMDGRDGNDEVYYKRSTDLGQTWGDDTRLTQDPSNSWYPAVAVSGPFVHVVWTDGRDGNDEIYFKHSSDGGLTWSCDTRLSINQAASWYPSVAAAGDYAYVTWLNYGSYPVILYRASTDGGATWGVAHTMTYRWHNPQNPSTAAFGANAYIVCSYSPSSSDSGEVGECHSSNGGTTWSVISRITNDSFDSQRPSAAIAGASVYVVWTDSRDRNPEIYFKRNPAGAGIDDVRLDSPTTPGPAKLAVWPNPMGRSAVVSYALAKAAHVHLRLYDAGGGCVLSVFDGEQSAGLRELQLCASSGGRRNSLTAGVYLLVLECECTDLVENRSVFSLTVSGSRCRP